MTVGELQELLANVPQSTPIVIVWKEFAEIAGAWKKGANHEQSGM